MPILGDYEGAIVLFVGGRASRWCHVDGRHKVQIKFIRKLIAVNGTNAAQRLIVTIRNVSTSGVERLPDSVVTLPVDTSGGVKSRIISVWLCTTWKLEKGPLERLPALHRGKILANTNLKMLLSSFRSVSGCLYRGSCSSLARSTCPWGMASMISNKPSSFQLYSAALQHKQRRCYKIAAEDTNKGVVSGLFSKC